MKKPRGLTGAENKAEKYIENKTLAKLLVTEAEGKAGRRERAVSKIKTDLSALFRMMKAWVNGSYSNISKKTLLIIITGLVYFMNPFDLLPDFIPGLGFIDDISVITYVVHTIREEISQFLAWEKDSDQEKKN